MKIVWKVLRIFIKSFFAFLLPFLLFFLFGGLFDTLIAPYKIPGFWTKLLSLIGLLMGIRNAAIVFYQTTCDLLQALGLLKKS